MKWWHQGLAALGWFFMLTSSLTARTIQLTAEDSDQMAAMSAHAPRLSWAMAPPLQGIFNTEPHLQWNSKIAILMRFPFKEKIPSGQRITRAELTLNSTYVAGTPQITVRRLLAEWGIGVCHQYRMVVPKKVEWAQPGGRGASSDRALKDSAIFKFTKIGEQTVDLTEDVELWYTGAVANHGWIFTMETEGEHVYLASPYSPGQAGGKQWKLQITFEPQ